VLLVVMVRLQGQKQVVKVHFLVVLGLLEDLSLLPRHLRMGIRAAGLQQALEVLQQDLAKVAEAAKVTVTFRH
jgi:hypothetical protein